MPSRQTTTSTSASTAAPATITLSHGKPLTRAEWLAKGDTICARTNLVTGASKLKFPHDYTRILPQLALYHKTEASELSKLVPPPGKTRDWRQIVNGVSLVGEYISKIAEYARANNIAAAKPLFLAGNKVQERVVAIAKRDGFKDCATS